MEFNLTGFGWHITIFMGWELLLAAFLTVVATLAGAKLLTSAA